jgi:hypothetical protein
MKIGIRFIIAAFITLTVYIPVTRGQANLTFSGGNNTPLSISLQQSVIYTITDSDCSTGGPIFVFDEAGNPFFGSGPVVSGTIAYSINSGAAQPILIANSGVAASDVTANDLFVYGNFSGVSSGSMVILRAGTITTNGSIAAAPPANGSFNTFLTSDTGVRCSSNGVPIAPSAASVSISGRVLTGDQSGLFNASVHLTDQYGNEQVSRTNPFGYYHFADVRAGQTVILTVVSKRFQFAPQVLNLNEEVTEFNFVAKN